MLAWLWRGIPGPGVVFIPGSSCGGFELAVTDAKIEEIYALADAALRNGQDFFRVHSFPFRMTEKNMLRHCESEWRVFWLNMKEGYDFFENTGRPPNVIVTNKKYSFRAAKE